MDQHSAVDASPDAIKVTKAVIGGREPFHMGDAGLMVPATGNSEQGS
jgi:hypothetical protein